MQSENDKALQELLNSMSFFTEQILKSTTKIYDGIIVKANANGTWQIKYNGKVESLKHYGDNIPTVGKNVKIFIPQGNANLSYFM